MVLIFFFWIGFAVIVGVAANTRGRSGIGWALLALLISPLVAGLLLLALPGSKLSTEQYEQRNQKWARNGGWRGAIEDWRYGTAEQRAAAAQRPIGFIVFVGCWAAFLLIGLVSMLHQ
jgi:hypothetical protein